MGNNNKTTTTTNRHHPTTTNNRSMSDTDTDSQYEECFSQPDDHHLPSPPSNALVPVQTLTLPPSHLSLNPTIMENPVTGVTNINPSGDVRGDWRTIRPATTTPVRRVKREVAVERAGLGFRILEVVLCLIAFSVMVSDKTQGWSGDSFDRYKEYRYVVAVNAIAFAYAAFQAIEMTYRLIYNKHIISFSLRPVFDFLIDQILAYLLISASSSAATRVDDWVSNWGKDDFTEMATASIGMSFLAFLAFAVSALISGYVLCNQKSL